MICPQTKAECKAKYCQRRNVCWDEKFPTPPKPTLAEFERLVDVFGGAASAALLTEFHQTPNWRVNAEKYKAARAALIDYVKRMGVE